MYFYFHDRYFHEIIEWLASLSFLFFFITEALFPHTVFNQASVICVCIFSVALSLLRRHRISLSWYFLAMGALIAIGLYNHMHYTVNAGTSLSMIKTLIKNFVFLFSLYQFFRSVMREATLLALYVLGAGIVSAYVLIQVLRSPWGSSRFGELFINPNVLGMLAALAAAILIGAFLKRPRARFVFLVPLAFFLYIVIKSGSRKGILLVVLAAFILLLCRFPRYSPLIMVGAAVLAVVGYFAITRIDFLYQLIGSRIENLVNVLFGREAGESSVESRIQMIRLGLENIRKNPIRGYGLDCFRHLEGAFETYSHNNYIELAYSVGIFGTLAYYSTHLLLLPVSFISLFRGNRHAGIVLALTISVMAMDIALVSYYSRMDQSYLILLIALLIRGGKRSRVGSEYDRDILGCVL